MFGFTCVPSCKPNKIRLGGGAIRAMFGFTCVPSRKPNKFRLGGGAIRTMFGFTCVPSHKPNKFRLSRVLSEECMDLLAACVPTHIHFSLRKRRRRPHFPTKLAAVASFSYKIGGGGLIFLQNWRRRRQGFSDLATLLAVVLTLSGYWFT